MRESCPVEALILVVAELMTIPLLIAAALLFEVAGAAVIAIGQLIAWRGARPTRRAKARAWHEGWAGRRSCIVQSARTALHTCVKNVHITAWCIRRGPRTALAGFARSAQRKVIRTRWWVWEVRS